MTDPDPLREIPLKEQPPWLAQLHLAVRVYPPDPDLPAGSPGFGAALCRWCDLTWPVPFGRLETDRVERAAWVLRVAEHGMEHAVNGDLRVDEAGHPLDPDPFGGDE